MSVQRGIAGLVLICAVIALLSILGLAGNFATRLESDVDGLLLLMVCLMMGGIFTIMLAMILKNVGWLKLPAFGGKKSMMGAAATNPADPASGKGKQVS
jgi:hypothetical protein